MGAASLTAGTREPARLALRLLRGREDGAREGRHQSGTAPYGYVRDYAARRRDEPGVPLRVEPREAEVVRRIFADYLALRSIEKVIAGLHASGIRTRRGKPWSRAGIAWMLKNETYIGRVHFGSIRAKGIHEPLIDEATFVRARRLMERNNRRSGRARRHMLRARGRRSEAARVSARAPAGK